MRLFLQEDCFYGIRHPFILHSYHTQGSHSFVWTKFKTVSRLFPDVKSCLFQTIFYNLSAFICLCKFACLPTKYASEFFNFEIKFPRLFVEIQDLSVRFRQILQNFRLCNTFCEIKTFSKFQDLCGNRGYYM